MGKDEKVQIAAEALRRARFKSPEGARLQSLRLHQVQQGGLRQVEGMRPLDSRWRQHEVALEPRPSSSPDREEVQDGGGGRGVKLTDSSADASRRPSSQLHSL